MDHNEKQKQTCLYSGVDGSGDNNGSNQSECQDDKDWDNKVPTTLSKTSSSSSLYRDDDEKLILNDILMRLPSGDTRNRIFARLSKTEKMKAKKICQAWYNWIKPLLKICPVKLTLGYLDFEARLQVRLVNHTWKDIVDRDSHFNFNPFLYDYSIDEVITLAESGVSIDMLNVSRFQEDFYPGEEIGFTSVRGINVVPFGIRPEEGQQADYDIAYGISEPNLKGLLQEFNQIECLFLHSGALGNINPEYFKDITLPNIKYLKVSSSNDDGINGFSSTRNILKNTFPLITKVDFFTINSSNSIFQGPLLYLEMYQFISRHSTTLKDVHLGFANVLDEHSVRINPTRLNINLWTDEELEHLLINLQSVHLDSFSLTPHYYDGEHLYGFSNIFLESQSCLKSLKIDDLKSNRLFKAIPTALLGCSGTLEEIMITGCICYGLKQGDNLNFPCSAIQNCSKLHTFFLEICGIRVSEIELLPQQLEKLTLGKGLSQEQIDYIIKNMINLKVLKLPQSQTKVALEIPKINLETFKQILKMPMMERLEFQNDAYPFEEIEVISAFTEGIKLMHINDSPYVNRSVALDTTTFNRNLF